MSRDPRGHWRVATEVRSRKTFKNNSSMARVGRFNGAAVRAPSASRSTNVNRRAAASASLMLSAAEPTSLCGERRFAGVTLAVDSGLMILEAFKHPSPFGIGLFARFTYFLDALRPSVHGCLRRFGVLAAFLSFRCSCDAVIDAAYAAIGRLVVAALTLA